MNSRGDCCRAFDSYECESVTEEQRKVQNGVPTEFNDEVSKYLGVAGNNIENTMLSCSSLEPDVERVSRFMDRTPAAVLNALKWFKVKRQLIA